MPIELQLRWTKNYKRKCKRNKHKNKRVSSRYYLLKSMKWKFRQRIVFANLTMRTPLTFLCAIMTTAIKSPSWKNAWIQWTLNPKVCNSELTGWYALAHSKFKQKKKRIRTVKFYSKTNVYRVVWKSTPKETCDCASVYVWKRDQRNFSIRTYLITPLWLT